MQSIYDEQLSDINSSGLNSKLLLSPTSQSNTFSLARALKTAIHEESVEKSMEADLSGSNLLDDIIEKFIEDFIEM